MMDETDAERLERIVRERDDEVRRLRELVRMLNFEVLHKYQHEFSDHLVRPIGGGSLLDWAVAELRAQRAKIGGPR